MKMTIEVDNEHILVYLYFYAREDYLRLNNGGEAVKSCDLLFDPENEWIGLSLESEYNIDDFINPSNGFINRSNKEWQILFNKNVQIARKETHGCITDLYNNNYTGIELILLKSAVPNRQYTVHLL